MEDSKLIQLFLSFSGYELANLRKFIQSPYHNQREDLPRLLEYLSQQHKKKLPKYDKMNAWAYCYGKQKAYKDSEMRSLMSFLVQLMEQFLQIELLLADTTQQHLYLAKTYQQRQLTHHAQQNLEQFSKQLQQANQPKNSYYLRACYEYQQTNHYVTETLKRNANRDLQQLTNSLEAQFIAERLRQACELLAHESVYNIQYDKGMLLFLLDYIEQKKEQLLTEPAIALYYYYYQAATQKGAVSEQFFAAYTERLLAIQREFPIDELRNLYKMAINYSIRRSNLKDDELYIRETWGLYVSALNNGILLENKQLSRFSYKNIISLAIRIGELDWVSHFIETYTPLLALAYQKIYQQYALGKWCFATKQYPQALEHLQEVEYEDIFLSFDARVIQLKIYYELGEYDVLDSFLQSFKMFVLRKKKKLGYHYEIYKNIIQITARLMNLQQYSKRKRLQLAEKIKTIPILSEREWLLAQLDKL